MPTEILRPDGAGNYTEWTAVVGSGAHWSAVDEAVADDGTSYIRQTSSASSPRDSFTLGASSIPSAAAIISVAVHWRATATSLAEPGDQITPFLRLSATNSDGTPRPLVTGYADYSEVVARPGGGAWAVSDLASLEAGVIAGVDPGETGNVRCTQVYVAVSYLVRAAHTFEIDRSDPFDDDFLDAGETITDVRQGGGGVVVRIGNDAVQATVPPRISELNLDLDNRDQAYGVDSTVREGALMNAESVWDGTTHPVFRGRIDRLTYFPGVPISQQRTHVRALGPMGRLPGRKGFKTTLYENISVDTAIGHLLTAVGWPIGDRNLGSGNGTLEWFWIGREMDPWRTLIQLTNTEGPLAQLIGTPDGDVDWQESDHRTSATHATVTQATFRGSVTEPVFSRMVTYDAGAKGVSNKAVIPYKKLAAVPTVPEVIGTSQNASTAASTNGEFSIPSGARAGDVVFAVLMADETTSQSFTTPTGWTALLGGDSFNAGSADASQTVYLAKRLTSTDSGGRVTVVMNESEHWVSAAIAVRGLKDVGALTTSGIVDDDSFAKADAGSISTITDLTTTVAKTFVFSAAAAHDVDQDDDVFSDNPTSAGDAAADAVAVTNYNANMLGPGASGVAIAYQVKTATVTNETWRWDKTGGSDNFVSQVTAVEYEDEIEVWNAGEQLSLGNSEVKVLTADFTLPVKGAIVPVEDTDFVISSGSSLASITLDQTSGTEIQITLTAAASGGPHVIDPVDVVGEPLGMRLRAIPIEQITSGNGQAEDATSITTYEERGLTNYPTWPYIAEADAQSLADAVVAALKDPRPMAAIEVWGDRDSSTLTTILGLEVSDQLRIIEDRANIDITGWCEGWEHRIGRGETVRTTIWVRGKPS